MKRSFQMMMALALSAFSFTANAQNIDVTTELVEYLDNYFVGARSSSAAEWDNTSCIAKVPITGDCIERGGTKIFGKASGQVDYLENQFGRGWVLQIVKDPWSSVDVVSHWVDLRLVYYYSGNSEGKKQCFPGNFFCGWEWESLHPTGRIIASFKASADHVEVKMTYDVLGGHSDKPNKILRDAMIALKPKMQQVVTDFIRIKGSAASVTIID